MNEMSQEEKAHKIVHQLMLEKDEFSQWMGLRIISLKSGFCQAVIDINDNMTNGFKIAHGGIAFSLADSVMAFASNAHGFRCLTVEASISYIKPIENHMTIVATAIEKSLSKKFGIYEVTIKTKEDTLLALLKGTVFRTDKLWLD